MVKRKVSQIGPSTLMVSLPSKWVKEFGIKKGDEMDISASGRSLLVETPRLKKNEPLKIDLNGLNANLIRYFLYAAYRIGADEVELSFDNENVVDKKQKKSILVLDVIGSVVENLIGFEIMLQRENYVKIKEVSSVNADEFINAVKRIFFTLVNTTSDMASAIENKNKILLERIKNLSDRKVNKLCDFCHRVINKGGVVETKKVPQYYSVVSTLEEIGDSLDAICSLAIKDEVKPKEVALLHELMEKMYKIFCQYDKKSLYAFYEAKNILKDMPIKGELKIELSKIASYCSKILPEIISLNLENNGK